MSILDSDTVMQVDTTCEYTECRSFKSGTPSGTATNYFAWGLLVHVTQTIYFKWI